MDCCCLRHILRYWVRMITPNFCIRSISLLSGHALTCQSPAKLALANTNNYTRKASALSTDPYQNNYMCVSFGDSVPTLEVKQPDV